MIKIVIGKSASGKDTYFRKQLKGNVALTPVVSYTSRPMRDGEVNGREYFFVTKDTFDRMIADGKFVEYRSYNTLVNGQPDVWYYGSPFLSDIDTRNYIVVLDVKGATDWIKRYGSEFIEVVYMYVDDDIREQRAIGRGSFDKTEWERRKADDNVKFSETKLSEIEELLKKPILRICNN